ncbi:putative nicotinate-nucleotide adenylyltransferase [Edaphobacter acidisoli]|uniref:Probable nicotinate-nucleotide adenylyltransferase n=1 Tax=Edaphobacter acidisoli TaxID=2040573 RepID=A0A916W6V0_9BACT|nr:nicotinate-nucleotide adenylyltransferase [Edaphobacter acidisoli]GGA72074.1 putative nicotinate-nucleotide adenylyltransferase [Edaphobacter acidisoli]
MRIALFGGTFDPPHRGHLAIAKAAADALELDRVLFAPVGRQPLKLDAHSSTYIDRLSMVMLASKHDHRFQPSSLDAPNPNGKPNYTVDTLTLLRALYPDAALFNLVGADSFLALPHWREPARLLELAEWIVVSRPGFPLDSIAALGLTPQQRARVHLVESVHDDVSATELRQRLHDGDACEDLLLPEILAYIREHNLYV